MEKFYLGLDIGTDSVGIACTDGEYRLLRAKRRDLWAVRLFEEAHDAKTRRTFRTTRRRLARRKERIAILQGIFSPYMEDEAFFLRLKSSALYEEDKPEGLPRLTLFADEHYTDKQFYAEYPTIFHLRQKLIEKGADDLRLYYLALHHIVKYRGHFLFEGDSLGDARDFKAMFGQFNDISAELFEEPLVLPPSSAGQFLQVALSADKRMNDKKQELYHIFGSLPKMKEVIAFLLGGKGKPAVLFEGCESKSFSLDISDEEFEKLAEELGDGFALIQCLKRIFDAVRFEKILGRHDTISSAMIGIYKKHKSDLRELKALLSRYYPHEVYVKILKSTKEEANYVNYIGYTKPRRTKINVKKCKTYADLARYLTKELSAPLSDPEGERLRQKIVDELREGTFLPKILHADSGLFPHQINLDELDKILANLCADFPVFGKKDDDGLTPAEKIRSVFLYRIPYFVGPLSGHGENSWIVRRAEKITPWNFNDVVDKEKSNEAFIRRMTGKCSYLHSEDVLPKCSMYYQAFDVLNQLNKLNINGSPISVALKQKLFTELFLKEARVTDRKIANYLTEHGYAGRSEQIVLTGKDGDFKASMRSYITLKGRLGSFVDEHPEVCEDIILWHTLCTDKGMVERYILKRYGEYLPIAENIKWIKGLTGFKDFGRLSYKFLCGLYGGENPAEKRQYTILGELYNTNLNLNELLYGEQYSFRSALSSENGGQSDEVGYQDVQELYVAPQVRRGIWQALCMVDEYVSALGRVPDKIFVEVTRKNEEGAKKTRTRSRKDGLLSLLSEVKDIEELTEELQRKEDKELRQDRLYLYYRQLGRCMYSGEQIDLAQLGSDRYDIDHIVPQSLVKDDSLDNRVLVLRSKNMEKRDIYPLPSGFSDQRGFWKYLHEKGLISDEKWARLTRTEPLTNDDYEGFVNRQLVYTNQMAKAVAELLARKFGGKGTKIVYSKASRVSDFRHKFNIIKCRDTNDLHHARDAYLNIVVGNVYDTRFSSLRDHFCRREDDGSLREIKLDTLFTYDVAGAWDSKTSLRTVLSEMQRSSMAVTRYPFVKGAEFYDQTIYPKTEKGIGAPRKGKGPLADTAKYGGYKTLSTAYFAIVGSKGKNGKWQKTIEAIPVLVNYRAKGENDVLDYLRDVLHLVEPKLIVPRLRVQSLVKVNGFPAYISGITGKQIQLRNAVEWFTDRKTDAYVRALSKFLELKRMGQYRDENAGQFIVDTNRFGEVKSMVDREQNEGLYRAMLSQLQKPVYSGISGAVSFREKLVAREQLFYSLTVSKQAEVLMQIIKFFKCNAENPDLSGLGEGVTCGKLLINKVITDVDFRIVHTSACGTDIRERKV